MREQKVQIGNSGQIDPRACLLIGGDISPRFNAIRRLE